MAELVRLHELQVLAVQPGEHRVAAGDAAREQRHALVAHGVAAHRQEAEAPEILGAQQLRRDLLPRIGRVGGVVGDAAVVLDEAHEADVLDPVALPQRDREDHPLGERRRGRERRVDGIVRPGDAPSTTGMVACRAGGSRRTSPVRVRRSPTGTTPS